MWPTLIRLRILAPEDQFSRLGPHLWASYVVNPSTSSSSSSSSSVSPSLSAGDKILIWWFAIHSIDVLSLVHAMVCQCSITKKVEVIILFHLEWQHLPAWMQAWNQETNPPEDHLFNVIWRALLRDLKFQDVEWLPEFDLNPKAKQNYQGQNTFLLDVIIWECLTTLKLSDVMNQFLLICADAFFVLDLGLHRFDGVTCLHIKREGMPWQCPDWDNECHLTREKNKELLGCV